MKRPWFCSALLFSVAGCFTVARARAQQNPPAPTNQPPPFTVPNPPTPNATQAPNQETAPVQEQAPALPNEPLPQTDQTTINLRGVAPLTAEPPPPTEKSGEIRGDENSRAKPSSASSRINAHVFDLFATYRSPHVPDFVLNSPRGLDSMVRDGKLYLTLHDAIALAIENNLDVEVSRYNLLFADTDLRRAQGGGDLRGIDFTIQQPPPGVGSVTSPLLLNQSSGNPSPTNATVTDLSQVTQTGTSVQENLSENGTSAFSAGPPVPFFDPSLTGDASYLRRSNETSLLTSPGGGSAGAGSSSLAPPSAPLEFTSVGLDFQQGFSTGAQLDAFIDNSSQVLYRRSSQYDPFSSPTVSATLTQPLLRGRGRDVNLRFVRIARINRKVSRLLFEQQLLETVYGVARLYYDLVSLGENVGVQQESLAAAQRLYEDDKSQVEQGTLPPIELTRAEALLSSSRLNLIQAQGEYRQQEVILREQLLRKLDDPLANFLSIVPTDKIVVPDQPPELNVSALTQDALANRPDLAQSALQVRADDIYARAARNNVKPLLNAYANVQTRGSYIVPYEILGSTGTGTVTVPAELTQGGLDLSTIFQGGVQLNFPLRNRIAQADSARDELQLRQAQGRTAKLENDIRQQIENSAIAVETAHQAYAAAVESRNYQQQLLQAEIDKFAVGASTNFLIVQDEAYLAQARSTEVAARSDWMKALLSLDRALGDLLQKNNVVFDDAVKGQLR